MTAFTCLRPPSTATGTRSSPSTASLSASTVPYYSGFFGQWGHDGEPGYVKDGDLAYVGTHRHSAERGNDPYVFTYMYKICLPVGAGAKELVLPRIWNVAVFAVTVSDNPNDCLSP